MFESRKIGNERFIYHKLKQETKTNFCGKFDCGKLNFLIIVDSPRDLEPSGRNHREETSVTSLIIDLYPLYLMDRAHGQWGRCRCSLGRVERQ